MRATWSERGNANRDACNGNQVLKCATSKIRTAFESGRKLDITPTLIQRCSIPTSGVNVSHSLYTQIFFLFQLVSGLQMQTQTQTQSRENVFQPSRFGEDGEIAARRTSTTPLQIGMLPSPTQQAGTLQSIHIFGLKKLTSRVDELCVVCTIFSCRDILHLKISQIQDCYQNRCFRCTSVGHNYTYCLLDNFLVLVLAFAYLHYPIALEPTYSSRR